MTLLSPSRKARFRNEVMTKQIRIAKRAHWAEVLEACITLPMWCVQRPRTMLLAVVFQISTKRTGRLTLRRQTVHEQGNPKVLVITQEIARLVTGRSQSSRARQMNLLTKETCCKIRRLPDLQGKWSNKAGRKRGRTIELRRWRSNMIWIKRNSEMLWGWYKDSMKKLSHIKSTNWKN